MNSLQDFISMAHALYTTNNSRHAAQFAKQVNEYARLITGSDRVVVKAMARTQSAAHLEAVEDALQAAQYNLKADTKDKEVSFNSVAAEALKVKAKIKEYTEELKALMKQIEVITDKYAFASRDYSYTFTERKGAVAYASIPELEHVDLDAYRKEPVKVWSLNALSSPK